MMKTTAMTGRLAANTSCVIIICIFAVISITCQISPASDQAPTGSIKNENYLPDANAIMQSTLRHISSTPLILQGDVISRDSSGRSSEKLGVIISLDFSDNPARAQYTLTDRFGEHLETMIIERDSNGKTTTTYLEGADKHKAPAPELNQSIRETGLTWNDLTLSFLWWPNAKTIGTDSTRGRDCYVIDLLPEKPGTEYNCVTRIWIDREMNGLLAAETYGNNGAKTREMRVKSLKKIDDVWMVKDMSFMSFPSKHRTVIRIRTLGKDNNDVVGNDQKD